MPRLNAGAILASNSVALVVLRVQCGQVDNGVAVDGLVEALTSGTATSEAPITTNFASLALERSVDARGR